MAIEIKDILMSPESYYRRFTCDNEVITYEGTWETVNYGSNYNTYLNISKDTNTIGSKIKFNFTGKKMILRMYTNSDTSGFNIKVDGNDLGNISTAIYTSSFAVVYVKEDFEPGEHFVEITMLSTSTIGGYANRIMFNTIDLDLNGLLLPYNEVINQNKATYKINDITLEFENIIYVDDELGNNNNNGTIGAPYKTVKKALSEANVNDCIKLSDGVYNAIPDVTVGNGGSNNVYSGNEHPKVITIIGNGIENTKIIGLQFGPNSKNKTFNIYDVELENYNNNNFIYMGEFGNDTKINLMLTRCKVIGNYPRRCFEMWGELILNNTIVDITSSYEMFLSNNISGSNFQVNNSVLLLTGSTRGFFYAFVGSKIKFNNSIVKGSKLYYPTYGEYNNSIFDISVSDYPGDEINVILSNNYIANNNIDIGIFNGEFKYKILPINNLYLIATLDNFLCYYDIENNDIVETDKILDYETYDLDKKIENNYYSSIEEITNTFQDLNILKGYKIVNINKEDIRNRIVLFENNKAIEPIIPKEFINITEVQSFESVEVVNRGDTNIIFSNKIGEWHYFDETKTPIPIPELQDEVLLHELNQSLLQNILNTKSNTTSELSELLDEILLFGKETNQLKIGIILNYNQEIQRIKFNAILNGVYQPLILGQDYTYSIKQNEIDIVLSETYDSENKIRINLMK